VEPDVLFVAAKAQELLLIRLVGFIGNNVWRACRAGGWPLAINRCPARSSDDPVRQTIQCASAAASLVVSGREDW